MHQAACPVLLSLQLFKKAVNKYLRRVWIMNVLMLRTYTNFIGHVERGQKRQKSESSAELLTIFLKILMFLRRSVPLAIVASYKSPTVNRRHDDRTDMHKNLVFDSRTSFLSNIGLELYLILLLDFRRNI